MCKISLFNGISGDAAKILSCFNPVTHTYGKGETITDFTEVYTSEDTINILTSGKAHFFYLNNEGHCNLLETFCENDVFGRLFLNALTQTDFLVVAETPCTVMQLSYSALLRCCENGCAHHTLLLSNLLRMTVIKTRELSAHLSVLSQRSIRTKLLAYLQYCSRGKAEFTIPYKISQLADYLCVDRCAMLRELKAMRRDGLLESKGRLFKLL